LATIGRPSWAEHVRQWGAAPKGGPLLINEVERSGLLGRGGANFPAHLKMISAASRRGPVVVANGTEGEPASAKDKTLLVHAPHLVLDGATVTAQTVGAREVIVCVDEKADTALRSVAHAISERLTYDPSDMSIRLVITPSGYVTGEESALVNIINGGPAKPTSGPRPFDKGVQGRPTLVSNVETLAHLALIARFGSTWFRSVGGPANPGTALVTVSGDVSRPAVYEIALGASMADVLRPAAPKAAITAALVGGYAGAWIDSSDLRRTTFDTESLSQAGSTPGCGSIIVLGEHSCGLKATATIARWLAEQSAGQCGPCVHGLPAIAEALDRLVAGSEPQRWRERLDRWLWMVDGRGACRHPDGAVRMVRSALRVFAAELDRHASGSPCRLRSPNTSVPSRRRSDP
jgi:NADH:ubiquinone oxidoreductase subunit F (NADH-binding)